jgi:hypothetical protein
MSIMRAMHSDARVFTPFETSTNETTGTRLSFPTHLDVSSLLDPTVPEVDRTVSNEFVLHSVLVHSGTVDGGHYYAYVCPQPDAVAVDAAAFQGADQVHFVVTFRVLILP